MSMLEARDIVMTRGRRRVLDGVSAGFPPGGFTAVIGPNGAGKSAADGDLAGLLTPDSGTVTLDGAALGRIAPKALARARAYLPQSPRAEWPISVERLVALGLTPQLPFFGDVAPDEKAKVDVALAACDLEALRDQAATTLSGANWRGRCWRGRSWATRRCCWSASRRPGWTRATRWTRWGG